MENQKAEQIDRRDIDEHRIFGLDLIRIICALLIYGRHSVTMYGCSYGESIDNIFIEMTSPVMTCFFVLSGFSLYYVNRNRPIFKGNGLVLFYMKRMISILPAYYLIHIIWLILNREMLADWIFLTPVELLGIQSVYNTLFGVIHNGGTWFISCIMICYFVYPLIQEILNSVSIKVKWILLGILYFISVYSYFVINRFQLDGNYANPFFRALEFGFGAALASLLTQVRDWKKALAEKKVLILSALILIIFFVAGGCYKFGLPVFFKIIFCLPVIAFLIMISYFIRSEFLENSRILLFFSTISYYFFLMQLILWKLSSKVMKLFHLSRNRYKIIVSFSICLILSVLIYEMFDKPVRNKLGALIKNK